MTTIEGLKRRTDALAPAKRAKGEIPTIIILPDNHRGPPDGHDAPGEDPNDWEYISDHPTSRQIWEAIMRGESVLVTNRWQKRR